MRRFLALARTAALESLAEPLSAVLFLVATLTVHLAPAFHYHQFGEAGRLARECGFSALLVFGLLFSAPAAMRTLGRELESGTAAAVLALDVSRPLFFCAKTCGVFAAFGLFLVAMAFATSLAAFASAVGALLDTGSAAHVWGPGLASGVGFTLTAFALAAAANRFFRARFCVTACLMVAGAQILAWALAYMLAVPAGAPSGGEILWRFLPVFTVVAVGVLAFVALAAALAVRLKPAFVASGVTLAVLGSFLASTLVRACPSVGGVLCACVPDVRTFWLVDGLANGGIVSWAMVAPGLVLAMLFVALWLTIGSLALAGREIS